MEQISNVKTLKERLKENMEKDRQQTEKIMNEQQKKLADSLKKSVENELSSIQINTEQGFKELRERIEAEITNTKITMDLSEIQQSIKNLKKVSKRIWIKSLVIGLSLLIGISAGSWGLMRYMSNQVQKNLMELQKQEQTLKKLQKKTWGLMLSENKNGKFIILPKGATIQSGFLAGRHGKREAIKLIKK